MTSKPQGLLGNKRINENGRGWHQDKEARDLSHVLVLLTIIIFKTSVVYGSG